MGFVEVGQTELTFLAVVVGQQAIHRRMRRIRAQDQIRPLDRLVRVTVLHQPARSLTAELQVVRIME